MLAHKHDYKLDTYTGEFIPYGMLPVWSKAGYEHFPGMVEEFVKSCGDTVVRIEGQGIKQKAYTKGGYIIYTSGFCSKESNKA